MTTGREPRRWDDPASEADTLDRYGKGVRAGLKMAIEGVEALSSDANLSVAERFGISLACVAIRSRIVAAEAEELYPTEDLSRLVEHGGLASDAAAIDGETA